MIPAEDYCVVLITVPNGEVARQLSQTLLTQRLVACVNILPGLESYYWWEGKIETGSELLLLLKTRTDRLEAIERVVLEQHPYQTPEILALPAYRGLERYLRWIDESLT